MRRPMTNEDRHFLENIGGKKCKEGSIVKCQIAKLSFHLSKTKGKKENMSLLQPIWKTVWQFLQVLNICLPYNPANPGYLPQINKSICPHRDLKMNVHSGFICQSHKLETVQMSSSKWMNKQTVVHNTMESYSTIKKDEQLIYTMTWSKKILTVNERSQKKREYRDFPGGPVVKNQPSNAGDAGSIPGRGTKSLHAVGQLSLWATTREPTCCNYRAHTLTLEPACCNYWAREPQLERSPRPAAEGPACCNEDPAAAKHK